jgi:hypothetical protein
VRLDDLKFRSVRGDTYRHAPEQQMPHAVNGHIHAMIGTVASAVMMASETNKFSPIIACDVADAASVAPVIIATESVCAPSSSYDDSYGGYVPYVYHRPWYYNPWADLVLLVVIIVIIALIVGAARRGGGASFDD